MGIPWSFFMWIFAEGGSYFRHRQNRFPMNGFGEGGDAKVDRGWSGRIYKG